jgi:DNA-binding MarR family transcriptional regulator
LPLTTTSAQLSRLVTRGHATRTVNPDDGRSYVFTLTEEGRRVTTVHFDSFRPMTSSGRARLAVPEARRSGGTRALETALRDELRALDPGDAT